MSDTDLTADDLALINEPHLGFLATVMADGTPQITPVWVDSDGRGLRFNTARGRVKLIDEGADEHIDALATKYTGADSFTGRTPGQQRVTVKVNPTRRPVRYH